MKEPEPAKPLEAARQRRRLAASIYQLKPLSLGIIGTLLISLLALLYLNEVGLAIQANQRLQQLAGDQTQLQQANQDLRQQQGTLLSPSYIESRARQMGMVPSDPTTVHTITIPGPQTTGNRRFL
jgi:cell division protein FtsL